MQVISGATAPVPGTRLRARSHPGAAPESTWRTATKHVLVIGGAAGMGRWVARHWFGNLADVGRITLADPDPRRASLAGEFCDARVAVDTVRIEYAAAGPVFTDWTPLATGAASPESPPVLDAVDLVVLGVPTDAVRGASAAFGPRLKPGAWLIDLASVKGPTVEAMVEHAAPGVLVAGTHPLFGITGDGLGGRTVVLSDTGPGSAALVSWLEAGLHALDARVVHAEPALHDRYMLIAQTMTHFVSLAFGRALTTALGDDLSMEELRGFATPPYDAFNAVTGRVLAQNHRLYAGIQKSAGGDEIRRLFVEAARELADRIDAGDIDDVQIALDEIAASYGEEEMARAVRRSESMLNTGPGDGA